MNNFNDNQPVSQASPEVSPIAGPVPSGSRRRLLRGSLAAPALLALTSTPVLACNCKLPSGFSASGNLSRTGSSSCAAPGKRPDQWKTSVVSGQFTGTGVSTGCAFSPTIGAAADSSTFMDALNLGNGNEKALIVAVYLQAIVNGGLNFPAASVVKSMWNSTVGTNRYTVLTAPVVTWNRAEVVQYLRYLTGQA
ncbi:hypothetical protein [Paucibacter sp. DJ2R-2]|uniref:hypothetical protein n=1 Tax=Paucibacter sp. DJ2R-2 TaxID=2893558 RepID=UPI0021E48A76|nr:hypothetical protein [Paucibacter sp. DJ2R-2]MCV2421108.1 hypothetical protein [Paucibacter sp. DJ4R-1]MCV2439086.1 hypothetical protein [Paucibacter sp. DJ2R-2]